MLLQTKRSTPSSYLPAITGTADSRQQRHQTWPSLPFFPKELEVLQPNGNIPVTLAGGGGSDVVTISPVHEAAGVRLAPIGLVGMLNAGGAVLSCSLAGAWGLCGVDMCLGTQVVAK